MPTAWLTLAGLDFAVGDFVAAFYPKSYKARIWLGDVLSVDSEVIRLRHWPINTVGMHTDHPYYVAPRERDSAAEWSETRKFWRLLHKVDAPQPFLDAGEGVYRLSGVDSTRLHTLSLQHALS